MMEKSVRRAFLLILALMMTLLLCGHSSDLSSRERTEEELEMDAIFAVEFRAHGWSAWMPDNHAVYRTSTYPVAFMASIQRQPEGMTGTIQYQANVSGYGWTETKENGAVAGASDMGVVAPLEGIRVWVNGDLASVYDVYTRVMTEGEWLPWAVNGKDAGKVGEGKRIEGIRIAIVRKGKTPAPITEEEIMDEEEWESAGVNPALPMVALTFDDGPGVYDDRILDAIEAAGGKATFFMVGNLVAKYPEAVRHMADAGCEMGNHSWNHDNLAKLSAGGVQETIQKTNDAILEVSGVPVTVVRPPYGASGGNCLSVLGAMGYPSILWSVDTLDWKTRNADSTVETILNEVQDGDIILMHSIYESTAEAVERVVPVLKERGFQLVTVSEMAAARGGMEPGKNYGKFR